MKELMKQSILVVAIMLVLVGVVGCQGNGVSSSAETPGSTEQVETQLSSSESEGMSAYVYLAERDGFVAVYQSDKAAPIEVTDVSVADLSDSDRAAIAERLFFPTMEEAKAKIKRYEESIMKARVESEVRAEAEAKAAAEAESAAAAAAAERAAAEAATQQHPLSLGDDIPFWGVWIGAFKDDAKAYDYLSNARAKGLDAQQFVTTDWRNLNSERYYAITAGRYSTREAADAVLSRVQAVGYPDAYVKYSGERR